MAKIYVSEYADTRRNAAMEPPLAVQVATTGGVSAQLAAFNANTRMIRIHTDGPFSFEIGANPTATTNSPRMAANTTEYFTIRQGVNDKLAHITNT